MDNFFCLAVDDKNDRPKDLYQIEMHNAHRCSTCVKTN